MRNFHNLRVWQDGMKLVKAVYTLASNLPSEEKFGLKSQVCRAAVSIPSNIAEGSARESDKHMRQFLETSLGSAFELETQLILIKELDFSKAEEVDPVIDLTKQVQRQLQAFIKTISQ